MEIFEYIVDDETAGMRIDRFLKRSFKKEPLSRIFQALRKGDVKVDEKKVKEGYRLSINQKITVKYLQDKSLNLSVNREYVKEKFDKGIKEEYRKMVIYENNDFFILNKAPNIPMHKGTGHGYGLSEVFKEIYNNMDVNFANRLDYETSGLVIGCKTLKFLRYISEKIRNNQVSKKYIALVHGKIMKKEFTLDNYLTVGSSRVEVSEKAKDKKSKRAITSFSVIAREKIKVSLKKSGKSNGGNKSILEETTLLKANLITGRKHQIRAQLSDYGYPIVGDRKYGKRDSEDRLYLCCYFLSFDDYSYEIKKIF